MAIRQKISLDYTEIKHVKALEILKSKQIVANQRLVIDFYLIYVQLKKNPRAISEHERHVGELNIVNQEINKR